MNLAKAGSARLLVMDARNPQIAWPKTTPIRIRPSHALESWGDTSGAATCIVSFMAWHPSLIVTHLRMILETDRKEEDSSSGAAANIETSTLHPSRGQQVKRLCFVSRTEGLFQSES